MCVANCIWFMMTVSISDLGPVKSSASVTAK